MRGPENMAEGTPPGSPGPEGEGGSPQGNSPEGGGQTPARQGGFLDRFRRRDSGSGGVIPPGGEPPAPPEEPPEEPAEEPREPEEPEVPKVEGLTPEEVTTFLDANFTLEELRENEARLGAEEFRQRVDLLLEGIRNQQADEDEEETDGPAGTESPTNGEGGRRGPEDPQSPEGPTGPEWETSPERGREIVKEIIRLETTLSYAERYRLKVTDSLLNNEYLTTHSAYTERNGIYLDQLYEDLKDYTRGLRKVRNNRDEWNPLTAYRRIRDAIARIAGGETTETGQQIRTGQQRDRGERPAVLPTESLNSLFDKYKDDTNAEVVEEDMATLFQEARALGLLDRADAIFTQTYRQIILGDIPPEQAHRSVEEILERNTEYAKKAIEAVFRANRTNPAVAALRGIAEAYTTRTADTFQLRLIGETYNPIEGEFAFSEQAEDEDRETYWQPGHYPKMYIILARTGGQFRKAADSFLRMVTRGSVGRSPDDLYQHFENFKDALGQVGSQQEQAGVVESEDMENLRQELEGHGFVFGGDYSFETYNPKSANQFLTAMALHEGPQRWVRLARAGNGGVGANLWKFDYDPRITLMHNPGGSRGQLLSDTVTQHYLHQEIKNILVEEGMGVVLKDYDPRDAESVAYSPNSFRVLNNPIAEQGREQYLKNNLERIGIHQREEEFKGMYEGFDGGDAHLNNYRFYMENQVRVPEQLRLPELSKLPASFRRSVIVGKVQTILQGDGGKNRSQLIREIDNLIAEGQLTERDKRYWTEAYDQSKSNFDTAFQMVGATGEKARRGGGVFFIDRKDEHGRKFVDNMPVYLAEKWVQYVVTRTKIQHANSSAIDRTAAVDRARVLAIQQLTEKGFEVALTFPKLRFNTDPNSPNFGDVRGTDGTETINFDTAVKSLHSRWTNHTYWSYQPENRHMLTDPDVFAAAKRIRAGISRPEEEDNLASFLLLVDPTLKRVARLEDTQVRDGESAQQQEIMLFDAAVEASNQGHWAIVRELNGAFMPEDGNPFKMRTGYNMEDYSGIARFIIRMRQFVASNPKRFARRYAAEIANLPLNVSSMPDQLGNEGVLGAIEMMADPIGNMAEQRQASQFAITKWVEQMRIGNMLFEALVGKVDSERGFSIEGLLEKPTNNSDKLAQVWDKLKTYGTKQDETENEFFYAVMESFDRLWIVLKLVRTMESDTRNAQGVLDLEKTDIFLADGKVNPAIAVDRNTGSSRHTERVFFDKYIAWLLSNKEGGGMKTYPSEVKIYNFLREKYFFYDAAGQREEDGRTWADWLFDKMGR